MPVPYSSKSSPVMPEIACEAIISSAHRKCDRLNFNAPLRRNLCYIVINNNIYAKF